MNFSILFQLPYVSDMISSCITFMVKRILPKSIKSAVVLLLYFRPPVREVCLNYEVVVFQPCTLTPLHLVYRHLKLHFNVSLPPHFFFYFFWIIRFPLVPTASPSITFHC